MTADLADILARASDPFERLAGGWLESVGDDGARYDLWLKLAAKDDPERARTILTARGLTTAQWRAALGPVRVVDGVRPAWAQAVAELTHLQHTPTRTPAPLLGEVVGEALPAWADGEQPWRFYAGFAGWMQAAAELCATAQLSPTAQRRFVIALVRRLLPIAGPTLMDTPDIFDSGAGWWGLWDRFPVMARLMGVAWLQWRTVTGEILDRLAQLPGTVRDVGLADGDLHNGGRSVTRVSFDDGAVWYLKPRPEGVHPMVTDVLHQVDPSLTLPHTLLHPDYVWAQAVPQADCPDLSAFWWRAGASLRVFQALGATDLHNENFVPSAAMPVLVDLETVIGAGGADSPDVPSATSMVSSFTDGPPGTASVDIGAMAGPSLSLSPYAVPTLQMGPDGPALVHLRAEMRNGQALPRVDGRPVAVADHVDDVVAGYLAADALLPDVRLPRAPADAVVRLVPRATQIYARLLEQSLKPANLTDGAAREIVLERLWLALGNTTGDVIEAEQLALRELDVPLFHIRVADGHAFSDRGSRVPGLDTAAPLAPWTTRSRPRAGRADDIRAALFCATPDATWDQSGDLSDPVELLLAGADRQWIALDFDPGRYRWALHRMGPGLIGVAGIGLALAAHAALADKPHPRAADTARSALHESAQRIARRAPFSAADAFTGTAGVVYALGVASRLLADASLLADALGLLPALTAGPASRVMSSLAGARLALLQLPDRPQVHFARTRLQALSDTSGGDIRPNRFTASLPSYDAGFFLLGAQAAPGDNPGDLVARAARWGVPETLPDDPLEAAAVAQAAWQATSQPGWATRLQTIRDELHATANARGSWLAGLAPDAHMLNAVHGMAAIVMLDIADNHEAPNVRVFR